MFYAILAMAGAYLAIHGLTDIGTIGAFLQYTRNFSQPITQMSQQINSVLTALAGAERIFRLLDEAVEVDDGKVTLVRANIAEDGTITESAERTGHWAWKVPEADGSVHYVEWRGDVRFKDVTFSYIEGKTVLHNISLYAKPGQKIAFVGSTGAGKTTITNLINRFYDVQEGEITYDGLNVRDIKKDDLRRSLGIVLQDTHLFTGTVEENIRYGRLDASHEDVVKAARLANADFFIRHLPNGYDTILTADGANLSQGQRQLLAIARAAVADPPVLILDEATSSIDTRTEALIEKGMDSLMHGRTVFVIAHRLSTVRNANAIMVLEKGEIIERGDHESLLEQKGRYYQLYTGMFELS
ncbi:MAG: ATP-binding cassette domain-containing protein [Anaerolineaceae bacterium]|nr:ATP-binding cassette domain-containing protein [Anaerolineaceae bacterium]